MDKKYKAAGIVFLQINEYRGLKRLKNKSDDI